MRYRGVFGEMQVSYEIADQNVMDALIEIHEEGAMRGDSDEEIAHACVAMLESVRQRGSAILQ
jgi:hypothetical protein